MRSFSRSILHPRVNQKNRRSENKSLDARHRLVLAFVSSTTGCISPDDIPESSRHEFTGAANRCAALLPARKAGLADHRFSQSCAVAHGGFHKPAFGR
jgi:hypothetical protein